MRTKTFKRIGALMFFVAGTGCAIGAVFIPPLAAVSCACFGASAALWKRSAQERDNYIDESGDESESESASERPAERNRLGFKKGFVNSLDNNFKNHKPNPDNNAKDEGANNNCDKKSNIKLKH